MPTASPLADYIAQATASGSDLNTGFVACLASLEHIRSVSPEVAAAVVAELDDQSNSLKMIASENYSSLAVQLAMGNLFTDKYAEGYPYHRFYAGCENVDAVEGRAVDLAKDLFGAEHAYVQPHSGADANLVAYWAILAAKVQSPFMEGVGQTDPTKLSNTEWAELRRALGNQRMLGMNYYSGGHLSHGYRLNASATMFEVQSYDVDRETNLLDYDAIRDHAKAFRPLILLAGYSAYSRKIDFSVFREIADEVGAVLMVDMAHFAGLVAGKVDGFTGPYDPIRPRTRRHYHDPQDPARTPRRHGALDRRVRRIRRQGLPHGPRRPHATRHGRQGRRLHRGRDPGVQGLRPRHR